MVLKSQPSSRAQSAISARVRLRLAAPLAFACLLPAVVHADTAITAPANPGSSVSVVPGGPAHKIVTVAVVAATDSSGNADAARHALAAANKALGSTPGYAPAPSSAYTAAAPIDAGMQLDWGWPFVGSDYVAIGKSLKVTRALTIAVTPGADGSSYSAVAELFDTSNGALINRGEATSSSTAGAGTALENSVQGAVVALGNTAQFDGVVVSKPTIEGDYTTRISLGELIGVRNGARVEYVANGQPFAYGSVIELGQTEAVCTVAPETAYPSVNVNTLVRVVNNPAKGRGLPSVTDIENSDFDKFETDFAIGVAGAAAVYYLYLKPHKS